jgi:hypothetical protein
VIAQGYRFAFFFAAAFFLAAGFAAADVAAFLPLKMFCQPSEYFFVDPV